MENRPDPLVLSLLGVLILAKILTLVGYSLPMSPWTVIAYFWQDVLVALVFGVADRLVRRPRLAWTIYAVVVAYAAINVPITRALSSPLTWTMMRAARGALRDSIAHYFTFVNLGSVALVVAAGVLLPRLLVRLRLRPGIVAAAVAAVIVAVGPFAVSRVDTRGMHRNAIGALVPHAMPRPIAGLAPDDWRASPFDTAGGEDLSRYRGAAQGRNVLVVVLESTAARYLKLYGAAEDPTPNLTALAQQAIVFESAYAVYPESIKELFALLCSRYPAFDTTPEVHAAAPCASLAAILANAGYRTALFHSGRFMYLGMDAMVGGKGFDTLEDAGAIGGNVNSSFGVDEPSAVRRILAWVDRLEAGDRFFVTYLPIAGHHPYATQTPGPFDGSTDIGQYRNALHDGDAALGELIAGLRARHLDDRTLVVVLGDHGEAFGQHEGNYGHTLFIDDENVRVPFVIAGATGTPAATGTAATGVRVRRVASVIDTTPTILDLLGLPRVAAHQGASLLAPDARMALFFTDYSLGWLGLRDGCWKYVYEMNASRSRLFDVCADANETVDRARDFDVRVRAYRDLLQQWAAASRDAVIQKR